MLSLLWSLALIAAAAGLVWLLAEPQPAGVSFAAGAERVIDGDTLVIGGQRVRLDGLDAPELDQTCRRADGSAWSCGQEARTLLRQKAVGTLACRPTDHDRYGRVVAVCRTVDGADLGGEIVSAGLAISTGGYAGRQDAARAARKGLWQGEFEAPGDFRRDGGASDGGRGRPSRLEQFFAWIAAFWGS